MMATRIEHVIRCLEEVIDEYPDVYDIDTIKEALGHALAARDGQD